MTWALKINGVSKRYPVRREQAYRTLRETLTDLARGRWSKAETDTFWALRDIELEFASDDVVGLLGHNGAGKSTLLKVLARITEPSDGSFRVRGRIGSLLEVGTGFHPELTGRENIYLNGVILGMRKAEIDRCLDEIVAFSEIGQFLDTPVKHYSSGMYTRLAFSVAAHLRTEVLLVDEVLAVGDAQFQRKCFDKMRLLASEGRCIVFVSHNMSALRQICRTGVWIDHGQVAAVGPINQVVDGYMARLLATDHRERIAESPSFELLAIDVSGPEGVVKTFDPVHIRCTFRAKRAVRDPGLYVGVQTLDGERMLGLDFKDFRNAEPIGAGETRVLGFDIESWPLMPGRYSVEVHLKDMADLCIELMPGSVSFETIETPVYGGRKLDHWFGRVGVKATATEDMRR